MKRIIYISLLFIFGTFAFFSCEEDTSCSENQESGLSFSLFRTGESQGNFVFYSAEIGDTLYPREQDTLKWLPFNFGAKATDYYVFTDSLSSDIIRVFCSEAEPEFLSMPCGFVGVSQIDSLEFTSSFIDSIWIVDPIINTDVYKKNLYIFY